MLPFQTNAFSMFNGWRPVQDAVASWVIHGALFRNPKLKVAVIEAGSRWLFPLMGTMRELYKKTPESFLGNPIEEIKNRIHISPFYEDGVADLIDLIGVNRVLFGSDFPHPGGLAQPTHYADMLEHRRKATRRRSWPATWPACSRCESHASSLADHPRDGAERR